MGSQHHRILRNYRNLGPSKFHGLNQRVKTALTDKTRFPDSFWAANQALLTSYVDASDKHDAVYHESMLGGKLVIAQRDLLQKQLIDYLDEIAALLEMAAVRMPDILLASGFDLSKERRGRPKATPANIHTAPVNGGEYEPA